MRFIRVLSRLALLSLIAAAFAGLTGIYGGSVQSPLPDPQWRAGRDHRPSAPEVRLFPEFVGEGIIVASSLWGDALYFDYGSPLRYAVKDNQFCWACIKKQRLPNHNRPRK